MPSGPMLGTHQPHRPPHTTGLSLDSAFKWKRTVPTDAGLDDGADHVGVHKRIRLWWDAQPNESRLSCGAKLECSQMEFYHTAGRTFTDLFENGRRQLQALLGCAPQVIARVLPFRGAQGALTLAAPAPGLGCRVDRCSERTRPATPARKGTFTWTAP